MKIVDFIASVLHYIEKFPDAQGKEAFVYNEDQDISYPITQVSIADGGHLQISTDNDYDDVLFDLRELPDIDQAIENLNHAYAMVMSHVNRKTQEILFHEDETFEVVEKKPKKLSGLKNLPFDFDSNFNFKENPPPPPPTPGAYKITPEMLEILEKYKPTKRYNGE